MSSLTNRASATTHSLKDKLEASVPPTLKRHVAASSPASTTSLLLYGLNRVYAYWSSTLNALIYGFLYIFARGIPPTRHTRPRIKEGYRPSVFVTGAHHGIGRAVAFQLAESGWTVFAGVKKAEDVPDLTTAFHDYSSQVPRVYGALRPIACDVLDQASIAAAAREVARTLEGDHARPLIGLVNNAGFCMISPLELTRREDVTRMIDMDLLAYIDVTKAFLPLLKTNKGRVVNIGSYGGYAALPGWTTYNAVKAGIEHLTRAWSLETSRTHGVRMATVRPGFVASDGIGEKISGAIEAWRADPDAIGFDSLGNTLVKDESAMGSDSRTYQRVMDSNVKMLATDIDAGTPAVNVAKTVRDALTEAWMQPVYTAGADALLGQGARDLLPEAMYEWMILKQFG